MRHIWHIPGLGACYVVSQQECTLRESFKSASACAAACCASAVVLRA